jgi:hypothetical protein
VKTGLLWCRASGSTTRLLVILANIGLRTHAKPNKCAYAFLVLTLIVSFVPPFLSLTFAMNTFEPAYQSYEKQVLATGYGLAN